MEELAGDDIDDRPVNEVGFDDGAQAADDDRSGQAHGTDGLNADVGTEDDNARLDIPFRSGCYREEAGRRRKEISDDESCHKGKDESQFTQLRDQVM